MAVSVSFYFCGMMHNIVDDYGISTEIKETLTPCDKSGR